MKILFDTSVLVAALINSHPRHESAIHWLQQVKLGEIEMVIATHTLAELYAVLTRLPLKVRIAPNVARRLINESVSSNSKQIPLSTKDYEETIRQVSNKGLSGGIIYDALIAKVAFKAKVDILLTFNLKHFQRVWQGDETVLRVP